MDYSFTLKIKANSDGTFRVRTKETKHEGKYAHKLEFDSVPYNQLPFFFAPGLAPQIATLIYEG